MKALIEQFNNWNQIRYWMGLNSVSDIRYNVLQYCLNNKNHTLFDTLEVSNHSQASNEVIKLWKKFHKYYQ